MYLEPFPAWPESERGRLLHVELKGETPHHTLALQHYEVPIKNRAGEVVEWTRHDWDLVLPKEGAPDPLDERQWERLMEAPEELATLKYRRVVRVRYRNKASGVIVSREMWQWHPDVFRGGALTKPYLRYADGSEALLYIEEWRSTSGKVEIKFPEGMIDILPSGAAQSPLVSAAKELWEEAGVQNTASRPASPSQGSVDGNGDGRGHGKGHGVAEPPESEVTITLLDQERIAGRSLWGMGQERWMFRVAVYGLDKGVVPKTGHSEEGELIKPRLVPIDSKLKHHFERYTEENGYLLNPQMKDEIDRIVASVDAPTQSGPLQAC